MDFTSFISLYEKKPVNTYTSKLCKSPVVSVCVQTYQHSKFIEECLVGILKQVTHFPTEILLGEDESNDGTREICIKYANRYPEKIRLFLHSRKNNINIGGVPTGRFNMLYNLFSANGKYIAHCEGDDYWTDPYKLQKQVDFLEANEEFSGAFHETKVLDELGKNEQINEIFGAKASEIVIAEDTISQWSLFHTSSFVFRKSCLVIPVWFSNIVSADMALFSIISQSGPLKKIPEIMSMYRKHVGGITESTIVKKNFYKNRIELIKLLNEFHEYKYDEKASKIIAALKQDSEFNVKEKKIVLFDQIKRLLTKSGII